MSIYAFAISIFFHLVGNDLGICIDYRSAESIGIRIVIYLKRTFNEDLAECVNLWSICGICIFNNLMPFYNNSWVSCDIINFNGVNSKSRHCHGSELNVRCICWPCVSYQIRAISYHLLSPVQHKHQYS